MPEGEASVGRFSLFCENRLIPVLTLCYKNLIGSHIYICVCVCVCVCVFFWAHENRPCSQDFYFFQIHPVLK